jgi:hypothetical protein
MRSPSGRKRVSILVDQALHRRMQAEAVRQRTSVSRLVRDMLEDRLTPPRREPVSSTTLLRLCGLAHGELAGIDIDGEL